MDWSLVSLFEMTLTKRSTWAPATVLVVFAAFLAIVTAPAIGQDYPELNRGFQSANLTRSDKIFLQAALAVEGYYDGLLDGEWGPNSQGSLERFSRDNSKSEPLDSHIGALALAYREWASIDGWKYEYLGDVGLSVLVPSDARTWDEPLGFFKRFYHSGGSLYYNVARTSSNDAYGLHEFTVNWHERDGAPFVVRRDSRLVTIAAKRNGSILYTRSDLVGDGWSTVMLFAEQADGGVLGLVSSSVVVGPADPIEPTPGGHLDTTMRKFEAAIKRRESVPPQERDPTPSGGSGSGFFVSSTGHVLTNAHVVEGCRSIQIGGNRATLVGVSDVLDLAVLATGIRRAQGIARFSPDPAKLNSDVTVAGYPYGGSFGGLNVTRGTVSARNGLGGEATHFQFTAPVQSGNSGGPVIAPDGEVVGVVVSKLDDAEFFERFREIPQNVNFAIKGVIAIGFLSQFGVKPAFGQSDAALAPEALAEAASAYTVLIECW